MRVCLLFFLCLSCFAAEDNRSWMWGAWDSVVSGASRLTCSTLCSPLCSIARGWYEVQDRLDKTYDVLLVSAFSSGLYFLVNTPSPVCLGVWSVTSLSVIGAIAVKNGLVRDSSRLVVSAVQGGARMAWNAAYAFVCAGMDG